MSKKKAKKRRQPSPPARPSMKKTAQELSRGAVQAALPGVELRALPAETFYEPPLAYKMLLRLAAFLYADLIGPGQPMQAGTIYASIGGISAPADTVHDLCTLILDLWREGNFIPQRIPYTQEYCRQEWQLYRSGALAEQEDRRLEQAFEQEDVNAPATRAAVLAALPNAERHILLKANTPSPTMVIHDLTQRIHEQLLSSTHTRPAMVIGEMSVLREERRAQILTQVFQAWQEGVYMPDDAFPYSLEQMQAAWQRMQEQRKNAPPPPAR